MSLRLYCSSVKVNLNEGSKREIESRLYSFFRLGRGCNSKYVNLDEGELLLIVDIYSAKETTVKNINDKSNFNSGIKICETN